MGTPELSTPVTSSTSTLEEMSNSVHTPTSTFGKKGQIVHSQAREIMANVMHFMKSEADHLQNYGEPLIPFGSYKKRAMVAAGISEKLYKTITKEAKDVDSGAAAKFSTPRKRKQCQKKYELVEGEKHAIRTIICEFHLTEKRFPTVKGILHRLHEIEIPFDGSEKTLRSIIGKLGFRWRKTMDNRKLLIESHDIRLKRIECLKQIAMYRTEGRPIYFTDESYIHTTHMSKYSWTDGSEKGVFTPVAKGRRLIMVRKWFC